MLYVLVLLVLSVLMAGIFQYGFKKLEVPGGYWNRLFGSVVGALVGELVLSNWVIGGWGWMLAGFNVIAGIIGSFLIGLLYIFIVNKYFLKSSNEEINEN